MPDGDTLGRFRNILLKNGIQQELFAQVVEFLTQRGLILKRGTIVDSTFIEAPSSTKNQKKERDLEIRLIFVYRTLKTSGRTSGFFRFRKDAIRIVRQN